MQEKAPPPCRTLAPELARGFTPLLIVVSDTGFYLRAAEHGPSVWHPADGGALETAAQFAMITALDLRVYPIGSASLVLFAVALRPMTVSGACALERADRCGPAETLLRRPVRRAADRSPEPPHRSQPLP